MEGLWQIGLNFFFFFSTGEGIYLWGFVIKEDGKSQ